MHTAVIDMWAPIVPVPELMAHIAENFPDAMLGYLRVFWKQAPTQATLRTGAPALARSLDDIVAELDAAGISRTLITGGRRADRLRSQQRRRGCGDSSSPTRPCRRQPTDASHVRALTTGGCPGGAAIDVRHPVNQPADDRGSRPRTPLRCFRQFWRT
jgi:hypothetical protein